MSTINLIFTDGNLSSIDTTAPWNVEYYINGQDYTSIGEGPGDYSVINLNNDNVMTTISNYPTATFLYSTDQFLAFQRVDTPELSTWLMMLLGFGVLLYKGRRACR